MEDGWTSVGAALVRMVRPTPQPEMLTLYYFAVNKARQYALTHRSLCSRLLRLRSMAINWISGFLRLAAEEGGHIQIVRWNIMAHFADVLLHLMNDV